MRTRIRLRGPCELQWVLVDAKVSGSPPSSRRRAFDDDEASELPSSRGRLAQAATPLDSKESAGLGASFTKRTRAARSRTPPRKRATTRPRDLEFLRGDARGSRAPEGVTTHRVVSQKSIVDDACPSHRAPASLVPHGGSDLGREREGSAQSGRPRRAKRRRGVNRGGKTARSLPHEPNGIAQASVRRRNGRWKSLRVVETSRFHERVVQRSRPQPPLCLCRESDRAAGGLW